MLRQRHFVVSTFLRTQKIAFYMLKFQNGPWTPRLDEGHPLWASSVGPQWKYDGHASIKKTKNV